MGREGNVNSHSLSISSVSVAARGTSQVCSHSSSQQLLEGEVALPSPDEDVQLREMT